MWHKVHFQINKYNLEKPQKKSSIKNKITINIEKPDKAGDAYFKN